ncbi:hypothetical protein [Moorena producens]|nr:hypothetical protein [Moorena producens]
MEKSCSSYTSITIIISINFSEFPIPYCLLPAPCSQIRCSLFPLLYGQ